MSEMLISLIFIAFAFIFYTIVISCDFITKALARWMIILFITGFVCDLAGTGIMYFRTEGLLSDFHGICGAVALFVMFLHLIWALKTFNNKEKYQKLFSKFSVLAWFLWVVALVSGGFSKAVL